MVQYCLKKYTKFLAHLNYFLLIISINYIIFQIESSINAKSGDTECNGRAVSTTADHRIFLKIIIKKHGDDFSKTCEVRVDKVRFHLK